MPLERVTVITESSFFFWEKTNMIEDNKVITDFISGDSAANELLE